MKQICCASTPWSGGSSDPRKTSLAPRVVESAAMRLGWIALICAAVSALSLMLQRSLQPEAAELLSRPAIALTWLSVVLVSLGIAVAQRYRLLAPLTILNLGLGFEVLVAFAISFFETGMQLAPDRPVQGVSKLAVWIVVVGLLIPNKPWIKLATALACASTWPLAYYVNLQWHGFQPLPVNRLVAWMYVPYLLAFAAYAFSKRINKMEVAVEKARALGSYDLVSRIGKGGMGEVWRARHRMLAREAAIKVIRPELTIGQSGRQAEVTRRRFGREAEAIASLQCPHTVYLFDFGAAQDGSFYYVMELLDGISLDVLVEKFGPQPASRVIHILRQACESLEEAHRLGLIHRDVKPSNVFTCRVGLEYDFVKVLDFGLVKNFSRKDTIHLTQDGASAGTPAYMAPETAMGETDIDGRVDIYGLGCVAYFLLTGVPVFDEKTPTATALAHVQKAPVPPSQRSEMPIPDDLERVVLRCLAKKPEDRPHSAHELARLLAACAGARAWTRDDALEWWQSYLPESSSHRVVRQPASAAMALDEA
jgi:eukaryotic-like serine/threonine-protein kinase